MATRPFPLSYKSFLQIGLTWLTAIYIVFTPCQAPAQSTWPEQNGQQGAKPIDGSILLPNIGLGMNVPGGDLASRYGINMQLSTGLQYITPRNWVWGADWQILFGDNVKEDVLAPFRTSTGVIPGDDDQIADIFLRQRGIWAGAGFGKLFPLNQTSRSGIKAMLHAGLLQHYIRFTDERNSVAQVRAGRYIGYDRLTRGFSLKQTISYQHLSNDRRLNFDLSLDLMQGWTSEVRAVNFDTGLPTIPSRFDWLTGIRLIWHLPFYSGSQSQIYY